jgi:putative ABC transport system permease protein
MTAVYERRREIGILKALGAKQTTIFSLFVCESACYGLVGGIIGITTGFVFSYLAAPYIAQNEFTAFLGGEQSVALFSLSITFKALVFSILVSCLAGALPARRASQLNPVEAISYE